jgi:imidazole glycerol-phosphate synthase subunit HisH
MKTVAIIDYGMSNLDSVVRAVSELGRKQVVTDKYTEIENADSIILPGVGTFHEGMANLHKLELVEPLTDLVLKQGMPCLGICLGMQLLATCGLEFGESKGLDWIKGTVTPLKATKKDERIPHVGWNEVRYRNPWPFFEGVPQNNDFYFVHSFHFVVDNEIDIIATTPYCGEFASVIGRGNIFGVQFHPEKSQKIGFKILENYLSL